MVSMATDPELRNQVLYETDPKWGNDKAQKPDDIPNESFRRLNVDWRKKDCYLLNVLSKETVKVDSVYNQVN